MKKTITGFDHYKIITEAQAIVLEHNKRVQAVITYEDGTVREARLTITADGRLMRLEKGRRRYGHVLRNDQGTIVAITLNLPEVLAPAQTYVRNLRRYRSYLSRHAHPNLWVDYVSRFRTMDNGSLAELEKADCASYSEAHDLAGKLGLPQATPFKSLTLKTCQAPDYVRGGIKEAIEREGKFSYAWRGNYDYSVDGRLCPDGSYCAWLSAEYRGAGNGHYYLLISPEKAIFVEDD